MYKEEVPQLVSPLSSISVFFPAYNDSPTIGGLVALAHSVVSGLTEDYEIIVVNDGSQDGTGSLLETLRSQYPKLRVIHHERNRGYGGALITGFSSATKEWIFYTDGDGQYDVLELRKLVCEIKPGIGLVNGFKVSRADSWYRTLLGRLYHSFVRIVFGLRIRDTDCDFRLIRRQVLDEIHLTTTSGAICVELVHGIQKTGCGIVEVPVNHYPRKAGRSQFFSFRHLSRTLFHLPKLWFMLAVRSFLPFSSSKQASLFPGRTAHSPV